MKKIIKNTYNVYLLNRRKNFVELLITEKDGQSVLIVNLNLENNCIFKYIPCSNFCYGNNKYYDEAINESIEILKKGDEE